MSLIKNYNLFLKTLIKILSECTRQRALRFNQTKLKPYKLRVPCGLRVRRDPPRQAGFRTPSGAATLDKALSRILSRRELINRSQRLLRKNVN